MALAYLEVGNWEAALLWNGQARDLEAQKPNPSNEIIATIHYILGTERRENNDTDEALAQYWLALQYAESDWLKSNLWRNIGLTYLKRGDFPTANSYFEKAYNFTVGKDGLRGSLPALRNYCGLALGKQKPGEGLQALEETSGLYASIFAEKKVGEEDQLKSHDFQSHLFHRGMLLCQLAEKKAESKDQNEQAEAQAHFTKALELLPKALEGRLKNGADEQRLGDVCMWLGRVAMGLNRTQEAISYFDNALAFYRDAFSHKSKKAEEEKQTREAPQITEAKERLARAKDRYAQEKQLLSARAPGAFGILHSEVAVALQPSQASGLAVVLEPV